MNYMISMGCGLSVCLLFFFASCDFNLGPPLPERYSERYLKEHRFSTNIIEAVLEGKEIDHETLVTLIKCPDVSVRHMLGRNRYLTPEQRAALFQDKDEFVRSGVAMNPSLTREEILNAMLDPAQHLVPDGLAINPAVPKDILIELRKKYRVSLLSFAQNSNCPPAIVREIEESGSSLAKKLLEITRRTKGGPK